MSNVERVRGNGRARRFLVTTVTETSNADADACVETRLFKQFGFVG